MATTIPALRTPHRPPAKAVPTSDARHSVGPHQGVSAAALAQSLSALADGNLLGLACGGHYVQPVLAVCLAAAAGTVAVFAVGRADEVAISYQRLAIS